MKSFSARILSLCLLFCVLTTGPLHATAASSGFRDVTIRSLYYNYVSYGTDQGLFFGVSPTAFQPERSLTLAEALTLLGRLYEKVTGVTIPENQGGFSEIKSGRFYSRYAVWAKRNVLFYGSSHVFQPEQPVSREELAVCLSRMIEFSGTGRDFLSDDPDYEDQNEISDWALDSVQEMEKYQIFSSTSYIESRFSPHETVTRGEAARIFVRLYQKLNCPLDSTTPRLRFSLCSDSIASSPFSFSNAMEVLLSLENINYFSDSHFGGGYAFLSNHADYQSIVKKARDHTAEEPQIPALKVTEDTFTNYNILVLCAPSYSSSTFLEESLSFSGETAVLNLITLPRPASEGWKSTDGCLVFYQVPKAVSSAELRKYPWIEDNRTLA